jgi:long-chain fatty acid transport protein
LISENSDGITDLNKDGGNPAKRGGTLKTIILIIALLLPFEAFGAAFMIYQQDAKAQGMGLAVVSSIDNPSAVFYNPALLPQVKGLNVSAGTIMVTSDRTFTDDATGIRTTAKSKTHWIPTLFANYTREGLSIGLGIYSPFGLSSEWPSTWVGRYSSTFAEIKTTFINPVIAYQLNDVVSFGFGVSYVKSSVNLKNALPLFPFPDGMAKLTGDGDGVGVNAALALRLPKDFTLSFTYRSPIKIEYEGKAKFYVNPYLKPFFPGSYAETTFTLPYIFSTGLAKKFGNLTLEADFIYSGWSSTDRYTVSFTNGFPPATYYKNWSDSPSFAFGANYELSKAWQVQAGYMYDKTPVPKSTLSPEIPDSSKNLLMAGAQYSVDGFKAALGYQATFYDKVSSSRNTVGAPRGDYEAFAHILVFNISYSR